MKKLDYAYCVARLRANETYMLEKGFILRLCESQSVNNALSLLMEIGWISEKGEIKDIIVQKNKELWQLLNESVPDKKELELFCVLNDFFNLKAAVKCCFTDNDAAEYYLYPTSLDLNELTEKSRIHDFSSLKHPYAEEIQKAYKMACQTENGQSAEIIVDRCAIDCLCNFARRNNDDLINEICGFLCDTANIKTALRINSLGKNSDFAKEAVGECFALDKGQLIGLSLSSREELYSYLLSTSYSEGVSLYENSSTLFEKWCDDKVISIISKAKFTAFGFDPVCAFYYKKQNEIKNINIILTALKSGLSCEKIKERVRLNYA